MGWIRERHEAADGETSLLEPEGAAPPQPLFAVEADAEHRRRERVSAGLIADREASVKREGASDLRKGRWRREVYEKICPEWIEEHCVPPGLEYLQ